MTDHTAWLAGLMSGNHIEGAMTREAARALLAGKVETVQVPVFRGTEKLRREYRMLGITNPPPNTTPTGIKIKY